jgi:hypothetical protein
MCERKCDGTPQALLVGNRPYDVVPGRIGQIDEDEPKGVVRGLDHQGLGSVHQPVLTVGVESLKDPTTPKEPWPTWASLYGKKLPKVAFQNCPSFANSRGGWQAPLRCQESQTRRREGGDLSSLLEVQDSIWHYGS